MARFPFQTSISMNDSTPFSPIKVAVVGTGNVGASFAYALTLSGVAAEVVLVDANVAKAEGEAMDLIHSAPFAQTTKISAGDYDQCAGCAITVVTAGANQKPGEPRLDLARKNAGIFKSIISAITENNPNGLIVVATNPVDVLTHLSAQYAGFDKGRVFGSGTILDTSRFRHFIGAHVGVSPQSVSAYIIGEHGDSEVPVWSQVAIGGVPLADYCKTFDIALNDDIKDEIYKETRDAAYKIIERKGATYYAIGAGLLEVVKAVVRDENAILPVGSAIDGVHGISDVSFGMPTVVGKNGAQRVLPLPLSDEEIEKLQNSASVLKKTLESLS